MTVTKRLWWIVIIGVVAVFSFSIFANARSEDRRGTSASLHD